MMQLHHKMYHWKQKNKSLEVAYHESIKSSNHEWWNFKLKHFYRIRLGWKEKRHQIKFINEISFTRTRNKVFPLLTKILTSWECIGFICFVHIFITSTRRTKLSGSRENTEKKLNGGVSQLSQQITKRLYHRCEMLTVFTSFSSYHKTYQQMVSLDKLPLTAFCGMLAQALHHHLR